MAEQPTTFRRCLQEAPRSLGRLSCEHPDGWGVALYSPDRHWTLHKSTERAGADALFEEVAQCGIGEVIVAHVRQRTVGAICIANTHPFCRGSWVFAHNGTIEDVNPLRRQTSPKRADEVEGETDSELLFAYLLSHLDGAGGHDSGERLDAAVASAVREMTVGQRSGGFNFLMSNGTTLYAYRRGRPLFYLERVQDGGRRAAILLASEPLTEEAWRPLAEGTLLCARRHSGLTARCLLGTVEFELSGEASSPELAFTD